MGRGAVSAGGAVEGDGALGTELFVDPCARCCGLGLLKESSAKPWLIPDGGEIRRCGGAGTETGNEGAWWVQGDHCEPWGGGKGDIPRRGPPTAGIAKPGAKFIAGDGLLKS